MEKKAQGSMIVAVEDLGKSSLIMEVLLKIQAIKTRSVSVVVSMPLSEKYEIAIGKMNLVEKALYSLSLEYEKTINIIYGEISEHGDKKMEHQAQLRIEQFQAKAKRDATIKLLLESVIFRFGEMCFKKEDKIVFRNPDIIAIAKMTPKK